MLNQARSGKLRLSYTKGNRMVYFYKINNSYCRIVYDSVLDELITVLKPGTDFLQENWTKRRKIY